MSLEPCKCASNSRVHASGTSRRRRSKQPTPIHQLTSGLVLCLKGLCSCVRTNTVLSKQCIFTASTQSRGFCSTRYINDKHLLCFSISPPNLHPAFLSRATLDNILQIASFSHLEHSCLCNLHYLSCLYKSNASILSALRRSNHQAFEPTPKGKSASRRSLYFCSTLYILHPTQLHPSTPSPCVSGSFDSTTPTVVAPSQSLRASRAVAALKSKTKALRHGRDTADALSVPTQAVE
ncbi:hypothetical protein V8C42DRAFT_115134 [Trichoderma barbatum]